MARIFDKLFFMGAMSLGDSFVYSGIVHHYGDMCNELHVPAIPQFYDTLVSLYRDHPHIQVVSLHPEFENEYISENRLSRILRSDPLVEAPIGNVIIRPLWDMQGYEAFDLPFSLRYKNFRMPEHVPGDSTLYNKLTSGNKVEPYILVHRFTGEHAGGLPIDIPAFRKYHNLNPVNVKIIEIMPDETSDMMQYKTLLENALEIHCVPSSVFCLVDGMEVMGKLYYHAMRASTLLRVNSKWNNYKWTIINYANKL